MKKIIICYLFCYMYMYAAASENYNILMIEQFLYVTLCFF